METEIRAARASDLDGLASVLKPDPSRDQLLNRIGEAESGYRSMLVAVTDSAPIGTVSYQLKTDERLVTVRLFALDVGTKFRRKGVGSRLVSEVERQAAEKGASTVTLEVAASNTGAVRLYERLGYRRTGDSFINRWAKHTSEGVVTISELSLRMTKPSAS